MKKMLTAMILVAIFLPLHGQERTAITDDGQKIIVRSDGTWYPLDDPHWTPEGTWNLIPESVVGDMASLKHIRIKKMENGRYRVIISEALDGKPSILGEGDLTNRSINFSESDTQGPDKLKFEMTFSKDRAHLRLKWIVGEHEADFQRET